MSRRNRVAIVEDDALISVYLEGLCQQLGMDVVGTAASGDEALPMLRAEKPSHILMDMRLIGDMDGVDIALIVSKEQPDVRVIYVTGSNEPATLERINEDHPYRILIKPINPKDLEEALA